MPPSRDDALRRAYPASRFRHRVQAGDVAVRPRLTTLALQDSGSMAGVLAAGPRHCLLIRHHLKTGTGFSLLLSAPEPATDPDRPIRTVGLRWPAEEGFRSGKDSFGLDVSQVRLYIAIARHTVLVMASLPSAPSPLRCSKDAPIPRHHRRSGLASRRQLIAA